MSRIPLYGSVAYLSKAVDPRHYLGADVSNDDFAAVEALDLPPTVQAALTLLLDLAYDILQELSSVRDLEFE